MYQVLYMPLRPRHIAHIFGGTKRKRGLEIDPRPIRDQVRSRYKGPAAAGVGAEASASDGSWSQYISSKFWGHTNKGGEETEPVDEDMAYTKRGYAATPRRYASAKKARTTYGTKSKTRYASLKRKTYKKSRKMQMTGPVFKPNCEIIQMLPFAWCSVGANDPAGAAITTAGNQLSYPSNFYSSTVQLALSAGASFTSATGAGAQVYYFAPSLNDLKTSSPLIGASGMFDCYRIVSATYKFMPKINSSLGVGTSGADLPILYTCEDPSGDLWSKIAGSGTVPANTIIGSWSTSPAAATVNTVFQEMLKFPGLRYQRTDAPVITRKITKPAVLEYTQTQNATGSLVATSARSPWINISAGGAGAAVPHIGLCAFCEMPKVAANSSSVLNYTIECIVNLEVEYKSVRG